MSSRALILAAALAGAGAWAQTARTSESYTGVVSGENVYIRSGPGGDAYQVDKLSYPAKVQVVAEEMGWLKIVPPEGTFSLISKDYVKSDGKTGTVTGYDVLVRAGSSLYPKRKDAPQVKLNSGDKVTILGELEGYYKITPPPGAYLYVSAQYVKRAGEAGVPTTGPAATGNETTAPPLTTRAVVEPDAREYKAFEEAEAALRKEVAKPRNQWNLDVLLEMYRAIQVPAEHRLAPHVAARIKFLQGQKEVAADIEEVKRQTDEINRQQAEWAAQRAGIQPVRREVADRSIKAEGILTSSAIYTGGATGPKRYAICDPENRLILTYVRSGSEDLSKYVGALVGVKGKAKYDDVSRTQIIDVEQVVVVKPAPEAPKKEPTRVIITPPAPAPEKPAPAPEKPPTTAPETTTTVPVVSVKPTVVPKPPTTAPADPVTTEPAKPLPSTGLPVAEPTTQPQPERFE